MGAEGKALVFELRRQLEAKNEAKVLTELRLVQYGWDLQSRLDGQKNQIGAQTKSYHEPDSDAVEAEKKKLLEAIFPASIHHSQLDHLPLETITSIAELITTAFELRELITREVVFEKETKSPNPDDERKPQDNSKRKNAKRRGSSPQEPGHRVWRKSKICNRSRYPPAHDNRQLHKIYRRKGFPSARRDMVAILQRIISNGW